MLTVAIPYAGTRQEILREKLGRRSEIRLDQINLLGRDCCRCLHDA